MRGIGGVDPRRGAIYVGRDVRVGDTLEYVTPDPDAEVPSLETAIGELRGASRGATRSRSWRGSARGPPSADGGSCCDRGRTCPYSPWRRAPRWRPLIRACASPGIRTSSDSSSRRRSQSRRPQSGSSPQPAMLPSDGAVRGDGRGVRGEARGCRGGRGSMRGAAAGAAGAAGVAGTAGAAAGSSTRSAVAGGGATESVTGDVRGVSTALGSVGAAARGAGPEAKTQPRPAATSAQDPAKKSHPPSPSRSRGAGPASPSASRRAAPRTGSRGGAGGSEGGRRGSDTGWAPGKARGCAGLFGTRSERRPWVASGPRCARPRSAGGPAPVDGQRLARQVGRLVAGQKRRHGRDVLGDADPLELGPVDHLLLDGRIARQRLAKRVSTRPGAMALTRMPWGPSSAESVLVMESTAALLIA